MEELRVIDESFLQDIKERLIIGLKVFETNKSPFFPVFESMFSTIIHGILQDVESYLSNVATLGKMAFGFEVVHHFATQNNLKRGGLTLRNSSKLASVEREYTDKEEAVAKVLGADVDVDHKLKSTTQSIQDYIPTKNSITNCNQMDDQSVGVDTSEKYQEDLLPSIEEDDCSQDQDERSEVQAHQKGCFPTNINHCLN